MSKEKIIEELKNNVYRFKDYLVSEKKLSNNTVYAYYNDILQFYEFIELGNLTDNIDDFFSIEKLDEFLIYLYGKGLDSRSIVRKLSSLSIFLKFLKIEGIISVNRSFLLNRPKTKKKLPEYLTVEEVESILNIFNQKKIEGIRDRTLFELIYSCGLRVSEVSNLNIESVYFKESVLQVIGKGDKQRYVPVGERGIIELKKYLENSRPYLLKNKKSNALFLNFRGERLTRKGIWKNLKIAIILTGIDYKKVTVHTLRHSFATHLIQNGADLRSVQALLGHKNITTTEIYTHLDMSFIQKIYNRFHSHSK